MEKILTVPTGQWNDEYKTGRWNFIEEKGIERLRSSIIAGFCNQYTKRSSLLDVGCGTGTLYEFLNIDLRQGYFGIDISAEAIKQAKESKGLNCEVIDAHQFDQEKAFDIIVFNEALYYMDHRVILNKYSRLLSVQGIIVISAFCLRDTTQRKLMSELWSFCNSLFAEMEHIEICWRSESREKRWQLKVLRKK